MQKALRKPVFFIGMPRSGTTILYEAFSRHPDLAWPSNYTERYPDHPMWELLRAVLDTRYWSLVGRKGQYGKNRIGNRYFPHPSEAYPFWNSVACANFGRGYLRHERPTSEVIDRVRSAVSSIARFQRRPRFSAKFTGPPRIRYLSDIFPDARYIHIVRDGRAVVHSLLKVRFWKGKGGFDAPFWNGDFPDRLESDWQKTGCDPGVLAALQWQHVVRRCREEGNEISPNQYTEVRYEDFIADPLSTLERIMDFSELPECSQIVEYLDSSPKLLNMNKKYEEDFSAEYLQLLTEKLQPSLTEFSY